MSKVRIPVGWSLRLNLILLALVMVGCGGGSQKTNTPPPDPTPTGSFIVTPTSLDFGPEPMNTESADDFVTLTNKFANTVTINSIGITGDFRIASQTCGKNLGAGAKCTVNITFMPAASGSRTGNLSISVSSSSTPLTVSLAGFGSSVVFSPSTLDFGPHTVSTTAGPLSSTLNNTQNVALSISSITVTPSDYAFTSDCGTSVAAGGTCQVHVTFTPAASGPRNGSLRVNDSASDTPTTLVLTGSGTAPATVSVSIGPASVTLNTSHTQQFTASVTGTSNTAVTWTVDGIAGGNATVGVISTTGLYTAPAAAGNHTVTATSVADTTKSDSATVSVVVVSSSLSGVFTYHNDNRRTGLNANETILTPSNVNATNFGKKFTYNLDGYMYAQPLYVSNLVFPSGVHNVVYAVTENDTVYAFDADGQSSSPLWKMSFINPVAGVTAVPSADISAEYMGPTIGITATPVIDQTTKTIFVEAFTKENTAHVHRLHALDLITGQEKFGGPVIITATTNGSGAGSVGGTLNFRPGQHCRPGLLLLNGVVYVTYASIEDVPPYHGWIMGYAPNSSSNSMPQVAVFNPTPDGSSGGIWSVGALTADSNGNIFTATGNGSFNGNTNFGDSIIKLATTGGVLQLNDYFTPFNQTALESADLDLGAAGVLILPDQPGLHPHMLLASGKEGKIYVIDRDAMGHFQSGSDSQILQVITGQLGAVLSSPAYWNNTVYYSSFNSPLKSFVLNNGQLSTTPSSQSSVTFGYPESPVISANGATNGIVWIPQHIGGSNGVLRAFNAANLSQELYNSNTNVARDGIGNVPGFGTATVFNGKVYVSTKNLTDGQAKLFIFGLLP